MNTDERLRKIADNPALSPFRTPLKDLAEALTHSSTSRRNWAKIDLFTAFDPIRITISPAEGWRLRTAELAQRLLVFCPVLFTWFSLALAVEAYNQQLQADPAAAMTPFLSLWQDGFDGRLNTYLRLGQVALIDAILISALLLATALAFFGHRAAERRAEAATQSIRTDLACALTEAALILASEPGDIQEGMTQHLEEAAERLQTTSAALASAAERAADVLGEIERSATALAVAEERASASFRPIGDAVLTLGNSATSLSDGVSSLTLSLDTVGNEHRQAALRLAQSAEETVSASGTVVKGSQALNEGVGTLNESVSALLVSLKKDWADLEMSAKRLSTSVAGLEESAPELAASTAALATAAQALASEQVTDRLNRTVATLEIGLREIRADLEALRPVIAQTGSSA